MINNQLTLLTRLAFPEAGDLLTLDDYRNLARNILSAESPQHPMQPVIIAEDKCHRFLKNEIVEDLVEHASKTGLSLNEIAYRGYGDNDQRQLAQLIGYSVSGYGELSYVSDESYQQAAALSDKLL